MVSLLFCITFGSDLKNLKERKGAMEGVEIGIRIWESLWISPVLPLQKHWFLLGSFISMLIFVAIILFYHMIREPKGQYRINVDLLYWKYVKKGFGFLFVIF